MSVSNRWRVSILGWLREVTDPQDVVKSRGIQWGGLNLLENKKIRKDRRTCRVGKACWQEAQEILKMGGGGGLGGNSKHSSKSERLHDSFYRVVTELLVLLSAESELIVGFWP
jgi:hypothetical protein